MTELTVEEIQEWCDQVENGDIYLEAEGYDDYQENSWDPDWITEYHDNFGAMAFLYQENIFPVSRFRGKQFHRLR